MIIVIIIIIIIITISIIIIFISDAATIRYSAEGGAVDRGSII